MSSKLIDVRNAHGFNDTFIQYDTGEEDGPVCSQCQCCVMPNRGNGTMCETCAYESLRECEMNYDEGVMA